MHFYAIVVALPKFLRTVFHHGSQNLCGVKTMQTSNWFRNQKQQEPGREGMVFVVMQDRSTAGSVLYAFQNDVWQGATKFPPLGTLP